MSTSATICRVLLATGLIGLAGSSLRAQEGTYPRIALIEEFTSVTCGPCAQVTPVINEAINKSSGRVVSIRYHVNKPLVGDPWYKANPSEVDARRVYYNFSDPPQFHVDGKVLTTKSDIIPEADDQRATTSPIKIDVTQTREGDQFNVSVKVTAGPDGLEGDDYKLRIVVVEGHIKDESVSGIPGFNGETEFEDVFRKMLPNPEGQGVTLTANQSKTFDAAYTLGSGWQADQMYVIAFVQNDFTTDPYTVVQTGYSQKTSGVESGNPGGYALGQATPNPALTETTIAYSLGTPSNVMVEIRNLTGELVASYNEGTREAGDHRLRVDLGTLASGSYTYTITAGEYRASKQLMVVK